MKAGLSRLDPYCMILNPSSIERRWFSKFGQLKDMMFIVSFVLSHAGGFVHGFDADKAGIFRGVGDSEIVNPFPSVVGEGILKRCLICGSLLFGGGDDGVGICLYIAHAIGSFGHSSISGSFDDEKFDHACHFFGVLDSMSFVLGSFFVGPWTRVHTGICCLCLRLIGTGLPSAF